MKTTKKPDWKKVDESAKIQTPKTITLINWAAVSALILLVNVILPLAFCLYTGTAGPFYFCTVICIGFIYLPVAYQLIRNHKNRNT